MKPDYKNWLPKGMVLTGVLITALCLILFILFGLTGLVSGTLKTVLFILFLLGTLAGLGVSVWMILMYRAFSYNGTRQMSKQIIQGIAQQVRLPEGGKGLDVGCGSGALAIACAKRNPQPPSWASTAGARNMLPSTSLCVSATPGRRAQATCALTGETPRPWISPTRASTRW